jgi:TctA family transporter
MLTTHLDLTFSFVWLIVVSNIITVALCFLFLNQLVKITRVRSALLIPGLILLVYLGSYADHNSFFDMGITLVFGAIGLIMLYLDWPRPPLILGLVLGTLIEKNLFVAYGRYEFSFFGRPLVIAIFLVALAVLLLPVLQEMFAKRLGFKEGVLVSEED